MSVEILIKRNQTTNKKWKNKQTTCMIQCLHVYNNNIYNILILFDYPNSICFDMNYYNIVTIVIIILSLLLFVCFAFNGWFLLWRNIILLLMPMSIEFNWFNFVLCLHFDYPCHAILNIQWLCRCRVLDQW